MKIRLSFVTLGFVALFSSLLATSQRTSAFAATDRLSSSSPRVGASGLGTGRTPLGGAIPAPGIIVTYTTYLPMVVKPGAQGIYGYLTQGGVPIGSISLVLGFYDGSGFSAAATTTTNSAGYYLFTGIPALGAGQFYYVEYVNLEFDDSRLWIWESRDVTSYTTSSSVNLGTSDLADIALVSPSHLATVALPYTFQWTPRPATPLDSYFWELFDPSGAAYEFVGPLGHIGNYTLTSLPVGFSPNVLYGWDVGLRDSNLGIGYSRNKWTVTFSNTGPTLSGPLNMAPQSTARRRHPPLSIRPER